MDSHTAFYFPPACKDRAVSSMEIKDFIILWKKCNILPSFLLIHIVDSTFHRRSSVPLSLQRGKRFANFPFAFFTAF